MITPQCGFSARQSSVMYHSPFFYDSTMSSRSSIAHDSVFEILVHSLGVLGYL